MPRLCLLISRRNTSFTRFPTYPSAPFVVSLCSSLMHVYLHVFIPSLPLTLFSPHPRLLYALPPYSSPPSFSPFISPFICHSLLLLPRSLTLPLCLLSCMWVVGLRGPCYPAPIQTSLGWEARQPDRQPGRQNDKRQPREEERLTARQLLQ